MAADVYADRVFRSDATRRTIYSALTFDPDGAAGWPDWLDLVPGDARPSCVPPAITEIRREEQQ